MKVIYSNSIDKYFNCNTGVGLGNFDGLHIGHMALINTLIRETQLNGLASVVYNFTKHPENILRKKLITPLLLTEQKKIDLLSEINLDYLYFDEFNENFSRLSPEEFVKQILIDKLHIKLAVVGYDYKFGYHGDGNVEFLKELGKKYGFRVIVISPITCDNEIISSTRIRELVINGDLETAYKLLGRNYSITAEVVSGRRIGNTIGYPTANINPERFLVLPANGVYITKTLLDGKFYNSMTNVGFNPTFEDCKQKNVETHIIDFNQDIYGKKIEVFFLKKIRDERKFESVEQLMQQISKDMCQAKEYLGIGT
ncbi:bifunctional riboflavin kinase/FAD synthetase [Ruminiclostridium herbifermentans]|uniref:Riboflavin biosynthesis protein n=1 Tax=Ruminiclostridium herbifermentans TaxID=2488810 RepID=A0A4U7JI63_9FIRM|nr:bifunctional riboflavin kinase/FAD synthetase [Ruminiclostridium herbifermentans]QNU65732.1 bifunctional riboflavin kinase/FAD synthetase [Ruminiclostridium herbifermentans]